MIEVSAVVVWVVVVSVHDRTGENRMYGGSGVWPAGSSNFIVAVAVDSSRVWDVNKYIARIGSGASHKGSTDERRGVKKVKARV